MDIIYYNLQSKTDKDIANERNNTPIKCVIAHCIGTPLAEIFDLFIKEGVSSHYFIPQITARELQKALPEFADIDFQYPDQVPVIQLVQDEKRAYHAGQSAFGGFNKLPGCEKGLNSCSIGIEFHAPGYGENGDWYKFAPYTEGQKATGIKLISSLMEKHNIPKQNLLAHSTIAPGRKTDPGPLFFWKELEEAGIGYLPKTIKSDSAVKSEDAASLIKSKLKEIGFCATEKDSDLIDSYIMQFASDLWGIRENHNFDELLLGSIINFDINIFRV